MGVLWFAIINRGFDRAMTLQEAKQNRLMNQLIVICFFIFVPYLIIGYINRFGEDVTEYLVIWLILLFMYFKNKKGHSALHKTFLLMVLIFPIMKAVIMYGRFTMSWTALLIVPIFAFMIYSKKEIWYLIGIIFASFLFFISANFIELYYPPISRANEQYQFVYLILNLTTNFSVMTLAMYYFFNANNEMEALLETEKNKSDKLLLNILPKDIAEELKIKGSAEPVSYESVTVMFTDFKGFTQIAEKLSPQELVNELDDCFSHFDSIIEKFHLEKLKTIGDAYMCAGGIPSYFPDHAKNAVQAGLEILDFMEKKKKDGIEQNKPYWDIRIGIHTGQLVAGVIGKNKFAYDIWGDTVNTASRMESSGTPGHINISGATYELVKDEFQFEYRGKINAKNKGEIDMYYVKGNI